MSSTDAGALRERVTAVLTAAVSAGVTPSACALVAVGGDETGVIVVGDAVRYGSDGRQLDSPVPAASGTVYDLASLTKVFTAIAALTLVDDGSIGLDEPVAHRMPQFADGRRSAVTLRHLLTHTSGLPAVWDGWRTGAVTDRSAAVDAIVSSPITRAPGTGFEYSCVGYTAVMALAEAVTGTPWAELVDSRVLAPLRAADPRAATLTMTPDARDCAATEYQPELGRGMVRGIVHDEMAAALGGGAGNAGMFGTTDAVAALGRLLLNGLPGVLSGESADQMWRDQLPGILGTDPAHGPGYGHGLGLRIGQTDWMSDRGIRARGHTGFTGTSLLVDREAELAVVLLTNRVHPSRTRSDLRQLRTDVADAAYSAARASRIPAA